ncbi:MAG: alpha/beta fold hydrolase, partial [Thermoanaerobaculia bacterium]
LYPFESRFFASSVGRVHYVDEGAGRPILMCHGNPTWSFLYRDLIKSLGDRFRCIAPDYPGFGLSDRPPGYGYTPAEHAQVVGELVGELDLRDLIVMGHDWGGPIGLAVAVSDPDRVSGLVLGNTWFWPLDALVLRLFSRVMSSRPMQRRILERNLFVERIMPTGLGRKLSDAEMEHYRAVQPTPEARLGVAEFPRQLRAAGPWLAELATDVPRALGAKRVLVTYPMRDFAFPYKRNVPRMQEAFSDIEIVKLERAKHYFQEEAHEQVAEAIRARFSGGVDSPPATNG